MLVHGALLALLSLVRYALTQRSDFSLAFPLSKLFSRNENDTNSRLCLFSPSRAIRTQTIDAACVLLKVAVCELEIDSYQARCCKALRLSFTIPPPLCASKAHLEAFHVCFACPLAAYTSLPTDSLDRESKSLTLRIYVSGKRLRMKAHVFGFCVAFEKHADGAHHVCHPALGSENFKEPLQRTYVSRPIFRLRITNLSRSTSSPHLRQTLLFYSKDIQKGRR
jgi:hypothetical protein